MPTDWPNRAFSRSVSAGGLEWHVQVSGRGPVLVLLHGTGASAHSWADLLPELSRFALVIAPDLPGHGFTLGAEEGPLTLPAMSSQLDALLMKLDVDFADLVVGHSAGAALALRWSLDGARRPRSLLGFNPSLVEPPALYRNVVGPLLAPFATSKPVASLLATVAKRSSLVQSLLESTRSSVSSAQAERYAYLFRRQSHVKGAMRFMAAADLRAIRRQGKSIATPLRFVMGSQDRWVPEQPLRAVIEASFPSATIDIWHGGHLLHEEFPARAVDAIRASLWSAATRPA